MRVRFIRRTEIAPQIWEYAFKSERPYEFTPGQYADFHLLDKIDDHRGQSRTFSITSLPGDPELRFAVLIPEPCSPYKLALQRLESGEEMKIDDAMGDVVLPRLPSAPVVFVAQGLGIASYVSPLQEILYSGKQRPVSLLWALRTETARPYASLLENMPFNYRQDFIKPERLTLEDIIDTAKLDAQIYLSGSQTFVEHYLELLRAEGVPDTRLVFDYYTGYPTL